MAYWLFDEFRETGIAGYVEDGEEARELCARLMRDSRVLAVDTETTGLNIVKDYVLLWSISDGVDRWALTANTLKQFEPLFHSEDHVKLYHNAKFDMHMLANSGIESLGDSWDTAVMDVLVDENRYGRHGLKECGRDYGIIENMPKFRDSFAPWYAKKYGKKTIPHDGTMDAFLAAPVEFRAEYASLDAWVTYKLYEILQSELRTMKVRSKKYTLWEYYLEVEVPFTRVLWNMERLGVGVDRGFLAQLDREMMDVINAKAREFVSLADRPININSRPQLLELFFEQDEEGDWWDPFGYEPRGWTDGGSSGVKTPQIDGKTLQEWAKRDPANYWESDVVEMADTLLTYKDYQKKHSTYVVKVLDGSTKKAPVCSEGRLHATQNQGGARTGRISVNDPSMQNIPIRDDQFRMRDAYIPDPGNILYDSDYEQIEMRLMAHYSEDGGMIQAIHDGMDLHSVTVERMGMGELPECPHCGRAPWLAIIHRIPYEGFNNVCPKCGFKGVPLTRITYDDVFGAKTADEVIAKMPLIKALLLLRGYAKNVGFGLLYGIQEVHLGEDLGLPILREKYWSKKYKEYRFKKVCPAARALIDAYFAAFPGVQRFIDETHDYVQRHGHVRTILGRYRRLPDVYSSNFSLASRALRQSVNTIIQGSAGDIAKMSMINVDQDPKLRKLGVRLLLQVHDELLCEMPWDKGIMAEGKRRIDYHMQHPFKQDLLVPLETDGKFGHTWLEAH